MKLFKRWRKDRAEASAQDEPAVQPQPTPAAAASAPKRPQRRRPATLGRTALELDYLAKAAQNAQGQSSTQ